MFDAKLKSPINKIPAYYKNIYAVLTNPNQLSYDDFSWITEKSYVCGTHFTVYKIDVNKYTSFVDVEGRSHLNATAFTFYERKGEDIIEINIYNDKRFRRYVEAKINPIPHEDEDLI